MPKDRTENIDRYKVRGGQFNDYQMQRDEIALTQGEGLERRPHEGDWPRGSTPRGEPETEAERIKRLMEEAREKVRRKKAKQAAKTGKSGTKKAAQKLSAQKTAKSTTKKRTTKASKRSGDAKKGAAKS